MIINPIITWGTNGGLNFEPPTTQAEVAQNVRMIITTPRGSVPLFRDFGIDYTLIDSPTGLAKAKLTRDIIRQVKMYEPRAIITKLVFRSDEAGHMQPVVTLAVKGGSV